jgi:hypothetical protein
MPAKNGVWRVVAAASGKTEEHCPVPAWLRVSKNVSFVEPQQRVT